MKNNLLLTCLVLFQSVLLAQESIPPHLEGKIQYPEFNLHPYMGVIDTDNSVLTYNPDIDYKVVVDVYDKIKDSTQLASPLREVGRIYNLNVANGVPKDQLNMVVIVHAYAVYSVLNDEAYEKKFGIKNPNSDALKSYSKAGIEFYICGQNLGMYNIPQEDLANEIKIAISAKTAFINFDQLGYSYLNVNQD